jgi:nucleoside-diphosphate-sugar epimerase
MDPTVLVVGHCGSIGNRWLLACRALGYRVVTWDIHDQTQSSPPEGPVTHAIIATPTATHYDSVRWVQTRYECKNILCEKPLCPTVESAERLGRLCDEAGADLRVVNNWAYASDKFELSPQAHVIFYSSPTFGHEAAWCNLCQPIHYAKKLVALPTDIWTLTVDETFIPYDTFQWSYRRLLQRWMEGLPTMGWQEGVDMIREAQAWTASQ